MGWWHQVQVSSRVVGSLTLLQHVIMEGQGALVRLLLEHGWAQVPYQLSQGKPRS